MLKSLRSDFFEAWLGILRRPFRFLLSGLGIGIGVGALIAMLSIGAGAQRTALEKISSLGINCIRVEGTSTSQTGEIPHKAANLSKGLTAEDALAISQRIHADSLIGAYRKKAETQIISSVARTGLVMGVTANWFKAENIELIQGRPLLPEDIAGHTNLCVLAEPLANRLGTGLDQILQVGHFAYRVVGLISGKGRLLTEGTGLSAIDFDQLLLMPITSYPFYRSDKDRSLLDGIVIKLPEEKKNGIQSTAVTIEKIIQKLHRGVDDYLVVAPLRLLNEAKETHRIFSMVMGAIASLSLLVGGIGVMNVMLANINEQTREIGLRIALGATKNRIIILYLCQSILLTGLSGIWGIFGGVVIAQGVQLYAGWDIGYSLSGLLIGPTFAVFSGIVFGIYPALRAASTSPAIALREN